jgi:hypothetical protein
MLKELQKKKSFRTAETLKKQNLIDDTGSDVEIIMEREKLGSTV